MRTELSDKLSGLKERVGDILKTGAKVVAGGVVSIGEEIQTENYIVRLSNVTNDNVIVDILDSNGIMIQQTSISDGETYAYTGDSSVLAITIYATAPAFNRDDAWARIGAVETPFAGAFLENMLQKYIPTGEADQQTITLLNSKADKFPSSLNAFLEKQDQVNLIVNTKEGTQLLLKVSTYKQNNLAQLESFQLGSHKHPSIIVTIDEATIEKIYYSKNEAKELTQAISNGELIIDFPKDFIKQFFWFFTAAFTSVANAFM